MKKSLIYIIFSLTFILPVSSQLFDGLNEDFLDSLPESIKGDVLDQVDLDGELEEIENIFRDDTTLENNKRVLELLKSQVELLGKRIGVEDGSDDLPRFGSELFSSIQTTYSPTNIPNPGGSYILDVGDVLKINYFGNYNDDFEVLVDRNGSIFLEEVGAITVKGLNLANAQDAIQNFVSNSLIGTEVFTSLSELRDIRVIVIGNVTGQGMYTLPGGSSILHAINMAGGITDNGSYRKIKLIRNGELIYTQDLYDLIHSGLYDFKQLRSGDIVKIEAKLPEVAISGGISTPGRFEIRADENLEDLISYAGGLLHTSIEKILIQRINNSNSINMTLNINEINNFKLNGFDQIRVVHHQPEILNYLDIEVSGMVNKPGSYSFVMGQRLSDILETSGGYRDNAYPIGGILLRKSAKDSETAINDEIYKNFIKKLAKQAIEPSFAGFVRTPQTASTLGLILSEFKAVNPQGRVQAEFEISELIKDPSKDILLQPGDKIIIPQLSEYVYVYGDVNRPGTFSYSSGKSIKDYLEMSGGFSDTATGESLLIVNPDGTSKQITKSLFNNYSDSNILLPGSLIYVQPDLDALTDVQLASIFAPIASALSISLASLNTITN